MCTWNYFLENNSCTCIQFNDFIPKAGYAYPSGVPEFTTGCKWGSCYSIFSFMCMFCKSFFVPFLLVIVCLLRFTDSDYPIDIFKLFLYNYRLRIITLLNISRTVGILFLGKTNALLYILYSLFLSILGNCDVKNWHSHVIQQFKVNYVTCNSFLQIYCTFN
jgi:hypothetical protein